MKKLIYKLTAILIASAVSAGAFLCCGFAFRVPQGVTVDGVSVGGKTYSRACRILRRQSENYLKDKKLTIYAGGEEFCFGYPDLNFTDDVSKILHESKKGGAYASTKRYYLRGAGDIAEGICARVNVKMSEPYAAFNLKGEPFTYFSGTDGRYCDPLTLLNEIDKSVNGEFTPIYAATNAVLRTRSEEDLRQRTRLLYAFSTEYDEGNEARSHNIRLACKALNGTIIAAGGTFSFNGVVGERTAARGYKAAKIISGGRFVYGEGGGVCQVSTTLYNAALLSGMEIRELHPHSLGVSYVAPSRDAMVSGNYFDFKFKNISGFAVFIRAEAAGGKITCRLYGKSDGWNYGFESVVTGTVPPPEPEYGAAQNIAARDGVISEGYLVKERAGVVIKKLIRRDEYAPVRGAEKSDNL